MPVNFPYKRCLLIAWIGFALSLMVIQHAGSQSLAVIHQVLTKSKEGGASIIVKLSGNPAYKVIGIGKREILIALKDTELSKVLYNKEITGDGLIQSVEINKRPNNVSCLLFKLREPYTGVDHQIEASKGRLHVQITGNGGSSKKTLKSSKIPARSAEGGPPPRPVPGDLPAIAKDAGDSAARSSWQRQAGGRRGRVAETPAPASLSRPGGIDQLLNPDSTDTTPDRDLFLQAAGHFQAGRWKESIRILREIIKAHPQSPHLERAYFLLAKCYDHMFKENISEHFVEVNRYYQDAISKFPDSVFVPDAMVSIGSCYFNVKNYNEALAYYTLVCENFKTYAAAPMAMFERGKILALTKKPQEAVKSFQRVEKLYRETPFASKAKIRRAKVLFDMNNFKRSLRALDEIMTAEPNKVYENPDILLYSGYNYYELGRLEKARDVFCKVLNYYPDIESNHLILARIADTYREHGMKSKASKLYNMVLRRHPDSEGGLISMLRLSADMQKVESETLPCLIPIEEIAPYNRSAQETCKEIMKVHGDNPLSHLAVLRLAHQQHKDKDYEGSVNILRDILAEYPDTPLKGQIKSALGAPVEAILEREQQAGNYGKIVGYYEEIKADLGDEDMPNLLLILGDAYRGLHLYDRAISTFEKAKKLYTDQGQPATLLFGLGESFYHVKSLEEAERLLKAFVQRYPEDRRAYQAYFLIGDIMLGQKKYEKAMAAFDLAMQKDRDGSYKIDILFAMGETYLKLGDNEQAASAFENALKISPKGRDDHSLQFRLAECYQRLQERDKTEGILNQIMASGDPFWSRIAEAKINEIEMDMRLENFYSSLNG